MKETLLAHFNNKQILDKGLFDILMERKYAMKDILEFDESITYRTINHWNEKGYLLTENEERGWRKFSFADYMWIMFLNELRVMDISFNKILSSIFIDFGITENQLNEMTDERIKDLKKLDFEKILKKIDKDLVLERFCWLLVTIVTYKTPVTVRFLNNSSSFFIYGNPVYHGIKIKTFLDRYEKQVQHSNFLSSISISIDSLIKKYIDNKDLDNISGINILTKDEIQILEQVRNGELKEITIFLEDGKPVRLELVDEQNNVDASKRIKENFFTDYQGCEYITNGGKSFLMRRKTRKKL